MPISEDILNLPSGAQWLKADLHVHTPASPDMDNTWKHSTPSDVVNIAISKGLDIIAITDHNTAAWCDDVRQASFGTELTVLPGVEISTHQGHILAIFDDTVSGSEIDDLLLTIGFSRGDIGVLEFATAYGITKVSDAISDVGGVAIAAHADGSRGFLQMIQAGPERQRVYAAQSLWAMEIIDPSLREKYQNGTTPGYPRRMPCIQSSDSWTPGASHHQLDGMGNRFVLLKMDERSLSGLKLALLDHDIRIRLPRDDMISPESAILGMWVTGGFLDEQQIRFNNNVNCFIGDTGSGKSVAIELIRFGLDQQTRVQKISDEIQSLLRKQLRETGTVHILVAKDDATYLVERSWGNTPSPPLVQQVTSSGLTPVGSVLMKSFFPIKGFSQSEIIEFSREPEVRLSLTDDLIDTSGERHAIDATKVSLRQNASNIISEGARVKAIERELSGRLNLKESLRQVDVVLDDPRIGQQQLWYKEESFFDDVDGEISQLSDEMSQSTTVGTISPAWPEDLESLPSTELLHKIRKALQEWEQYVVCSRTQAKVKLGALETLVASLRAQWARRFEEAENRYRDLLKNLDENGVGLQTLSERRRVVQQQLDHLAERERQLREEVMPRVESLEAEREQLLDALQESRQAITAMRVGKAGELTRRLDGSIRLKVHARSRVALFASALQEIARGSYLQAPDFARVIGEYHPISLVKKLLSKDYGAIASRSGLESGKAARLMETIVSRQRLGDLYELQLTDVDDVIEVNLEVSQGNYRRLEDLSHGQKCMVVLMVSLAEGGFPLLVDQPEDALHAPSIEEGIVSTLRSDRGVRQCIFATRNANILVSADAEQVIALQADAVQGRVAGTGSLDRFNQRRLIIYHVEGGEEAFRRRRTIYTLEPSD